MDFIMIFVIASGKGGVGKSTFCALTGRCLAARSKKTLLIDGDAGINSLQIMLGVSEHAANNWRDAALEECEPEDAILPVAENLFLFPAPPYCGDEVGPDEMRKLTNSLREQYDFILIDAPAGLGNGFALAAAGADKALVVATPDAVCVKGAYAAAERLQQLGLTDTRLIINRFSLPAVNSRKLFNIDSVIDKTAIQLLGVIPEDAQIIYSSVTDKMPGARSVSTKAAARIAARMDGKNVPLRLKALK